MTTAKREYTDDMDELSGFGGGYEANCRAMVLGGLDWWDEHPDADPQFKGFKGVYGLMISEDDEAKALSEAMVAATPDRDVTGAMHQAATSHVLWIRSNGWGKYVEESRERAAKDKD